MKAAYTGWTWITNREPEAAKNQLKQAFQECKFLGYDTVENFAFIRDYYADDPQALVDLTKECGVDLVNLYGHFTFDVEEAIRIAKEQIDFCAAVGVKWYNCQNAGFGDDGPSERPTNPEMLDKQRVLAVTKCDMLDQELMDEIDPTLPEGIPHIFISAVSGMGISTLKDILWEELNKESNKIEGKVDSIAHRAKDLSHLQEELKEEGEDEDLSYEYVNDDEDIENLEDFEYEEDWEEDKK